MNDKVNNTIKIILDDVKTRKIPRTTEEKHKLVSDMIKYYDSTQELYEMIKWIQGAVLYTIDKHNLYNYLDGGSGDTTRNMTIYRFFESQSIAPSTARTRKDIWTFYIVKNRIPINLLAQADSHKLFRAIKVLKERPRAEVMQAVRDAKRKLLSRADYYKLYNI